MLSRCKEKEKANILTLADKCLKNQHIPLRLFILTEIEISSLKLICQNVFTLSEWYHICSQSSVSGWASTPNSSVPHCLTYQGRFDPEPAWVKSHIFVKLARTHETAFCVRVRLLEGREHLILFKACQDSIIATGCSRMFSDTVPACKFVLHILKWLCFWSGSHKEGSFGEVANGQCKLIVMGRRYGVMANTEMSLEKNNA